MTSHLRHEERRRLGSLRHDAKGILHMSAADNHNKPNQIIINNERGSSAQAEIDRIVQKAKEFCTESESNKAKTEAKERLRNL